MTVLQTDPSQRSRFAPYRGLNIVRSRGRWYVSTRKKPFIPIVRGFTGSKEELVEHLRSREIEQKIIATGCERRKGVDTHIPFLRERIAKRVFAACRKRAAARGAVVGIDAEWIMQRLVAHNDRCEVTGLPFDYRPRAQRGDWHKNPRAPSPDRIDRSKGYIEGNVRMILASVNIAINEWGLAHLHEIATCIVSRESRLAI